MAFCPSHSHIHTCPYNIQKYKNDGFFSNAYLYVFMFSYSFFYEIGFNRDASVSRSLEWELVNVIFSCFRKLLVTFFPFSTYFCGSSKMAKVRCSDGNITAAG